MTITINGSGTITGATTLATTVASPAFTTPNIDSAQIPTVSGTAPLYMCRAWVNFNGTGTVAIRASGNVSSITDDGTGNYTVNFTNALVDTNYSANVTVSLDGTPNVNGTVRQCMVNASGTMTTTSCGVSSFQTVGTSVNDAAVMNVAIFR
jgi:hypothetical protein